MSSKAGGSKRKQAAGVKLIADNRRARYEYSLSDSYEAGIVLKGSEVKALRSGRASIAESYAHIKDGEAFLVNAHIPEYSKATALEVYNPRRVRKLLLHGVELRKINKALTQRGMTLVPLKLFFNARGLVKVDLAIAQGKKLHDKRETEKARDWQREKARLMKGG